MKTVKLQAATPYLAAYLLFQRDGKIAFLLRENTSWMNGYYSLPSGKVEEEEKASVAAIREAKEEVGITLSPDNLRPAAAFHRNEDGNDWIDILFEVVDWQGEIVNAEPHMHKQLDWLDPHHLPENMIPSLRFYIEQFLAGKHYAEYGWN